MPREEFAGRYISVYFDTIEEKKHWEGVAREHGTTLSKLVFEGLEMLRPRVEAGPRIDLLNENARLKDELAKAEREIKLQASLIEKYESELYRARHASFHEKVPSGDGSRRYDMELINLLKSGKAYDSRGLLAALRIDPGDVEATQLVTNQLDALQRYGLVKESSHGWRWNK